MFGEILWAFSGHLQNAWQFNGCFPVIAHPTRSNV
jgi:hypothetical protein